MLFKHWISNTTVKPRTSKFRLFYDEVRLVFYIAAGTTVQFGSHIPKAYTRDSAVVAGKGRTCLTSAVVTGKTGVTCQQVATV
jgi:hypothetical protein